MFVCTLSERVCCAEITSLVSVFCLIASVVCACVVQEVATNLASGPSLLTISTCVHKNPYKSLHISLYCSLISPSDVVI